MPIFCLFLALVRSGCVLILARVVLVLSGNCVQLNFPDFHFAGHQVSDEILCLAIRIVDEAITDISEFLSDDEVAEVADALNGLVNRWRNPPTA